MSQLPFEHRDVLDDLFDGVYCVDRTRKILYWNRAASELTSYRVDEMLGVRCVNSPLCHTDGDGNSLCRSQCPMAATMRDGKRREQRVFLLHRDGHRKPVRVRCSPLRDATGEIVGAVESFVDDTPSLALEERVEELERVAALDSLTSLPNRRFATQQLESKHGEWMRYGWPYGVLLLDIDHFKHVNDTWGHEAGDRALVSVARTLSVKTRVSDVVARWGGEEFLVIARCGAPEQLTVMAESLRGLVASGRFRTRDEDIQSVTVSIGGALADVGDEPTDVVRRADDALYEAKRSGRNRFVFHQHARLRMAGGT